MRTVYFSEQSWFFSKKNNFQGLRTGNDCCTEHEIGIKPIREAFGLDWEAESLERYRVNILPAGLHFIDNGRFIGIIYRNFFPLDPDAMAKDHERCCFDNQPVIGWDDESFIIMAPVGQKKYVKAIKDLWSAFLGKDVWLGGPFTDKFSGSGLGFFIASKMPIEEIRQANEILAQEKAKKKALDDAVEREGFNDVVKDLKEAGREWFFLGPKSIREDGKVWYWLNPEDQRNNLFGMVTIDDLRHWVHGKGRIPANMPE